ncbi:ankyrin repeat-containing domain protein [Aspergillus heterothallicus]
MSWLALPIDVEYIILDYLSHLSIRETDDTWKTPLSCLCVCRRWHATLQELLIRNNAASTLLAQLHKIGQIAVQRAAADYVARKTGADVSPRTRTAYSAWTLFYGSEKDHLSDDLERCTRIACARGDIASLRTCLDTGAPHNAWWMLMTALDSEHVETMRVILDGGYVGAEHRENMLVRILKRAVYRDQSAAVQLLLETGVRLGGVRCQILSGGQYHSVSLVSYAAFLGHAGVLRVLLAHGAEVEDPGFHIRPVNWAVTRDNLEMMEVFIEHGAVLGPRDNGEDWPLLWAVQSGSAEMVELLLKKTGMPRWGSALSNMLLRAVRDRGSDEISAVIASAKK